MAEQLPYRIIDLDYPIEPIDERTINNLASIGYHVLSVDWVHGTVLMEHETVARRRVSQS